MADFHVFDAFKENVGSALINIASHTFKVMASNTAPNTVTAALKADVTEISAGSGYSAGGVTLANSYFTETGSGSGIFEFGADNFTIAASGGSVGPFRYLIVYDDTATGDPLVGYWDYGSSITLADGNTFSSNLGVDGILQVS